MKALFRSSGSKGKGKASTDPNHNNNNNNDNTANMSTATSDETNSETTTSGAKQSQARRAQVRSAQIRHRQRKANYITELERDVNEYREMIAAAQKVASELRGENEAIRRRLAAAGIGLDGKQIQQYQQQQAGDTPMDLTVTLAMDELMGTPSFSISSTSPPSGPGQDQGQQGGGCQYNSTDNIWLTIAQEQTAINFILALEHICWNHFHSRENYALRVIQAVANEGTGHTLMASSYCMASAPDSVYKDRKSLPSSLPSSSSSPSSLATATPTALPSSSSSPSQSSSSASIRWSAPRISLSNLRGLADSLNPGDLELTPIQAWFELAERYPIALLLEGPGSTLDAVKRELKGLVKCLHYGAVIERESFESVVGRVMDPALLELQQSLGIDLA